MVFEQHRDSLKTGKVSSNQRIYFLAISVKGA